MMELQNLKKRPFPEAYTTYALYDADSNQYDSEDGGLRKDPPLSVV